MSTFNETTPLTLGTPQFTHKELVELAGIEVKSLRNWTNRGILDIGTRQDNGRFLYSGVDIFQTKCMVQLVNELGLSTALASKTILDGLKRIVELHRDAEGHLKTRPEDYDPVFMPVYFSKEELKTRWVRKSELEKYFNVQKKPVVMFPVDSIFWELHTVLCDLLIEETQN